MAEGFAREIGKGLVEAYSAGLMLAGVVRLKAIAVMKEAGIDISHQKSKAIDTELLEKMDIIVTKCRSILPHDSASTFAGRSGLSNDPIGIGYI